ncbi:hypothetical protein AB4Y38_24715 [Paraburkholderia sp. EG285A]|uniref:hypothetical protein n=1 Tax=Paraburkholderia sp. EG285A TaxID=3237009 RepID=UPI0034D38859
MQNGDATGQRGVGANWLPALGWAIVADNRYIKGNGYLDNNHAHQIMATVDHFLSKRAVVYAETVHQRTNAGAQALIRGVLYPDGISSDPNQFTTHVGMQT